MFFFLLLDLNTKKQKSTIVRLAIIIANTELCISENVTILSFISQSWWTSEVRHVMRCQSTKSCIPIMRRLLRFSNKSSTMSCTIILKSDWVIHQRYTQSLNICVSILRWQNRLWDTSGSGCFREDSQTEN